MSKKNGLTPFDINNLKPRAERFEVPDPGCRGLKVRVFPSGRKSYVLRYRHDGKQRNMLLGWVLDPKVPEPPADTPVLETPMSLAAARALATQAVWQARSGNDPATAKLAAKVEKRAVRRAAESNTFAAISAEYLRREGGKLRTRAQRESDLKLISESDLGMWPLEAIKRGQFVLELDKIADKRGEVRSDRVLSAVKTLLAWHGSRSDYVNVLAGTRRRTSIAQRARSRILDDDELRKVWLAAEQDQGPFGPFVRFLLLTATRRSEAAGLARRELSPDGTLWTLPAARSKTNKDLLVPLSAAAQQIIKARPVNGGEFVFSADGRRPLLGMAQRKARFDQQSGVIGWVLHDTRRTARTLLARAGISADIAELCLGHAMAPIRGTYDRFQYIDERRAAFSELAELISRIVRPPPIPVADLAAERSKRRK